MKKHLFNLIPLSVILIFGCTKKSDDPIESNDTLRINMGVHCGWNSRLDSLFIDVNDASLEQNYVTAPINATIKLSAQEVLSDQEVLDLRSKLDWNYFKSLSYNSGDLGSDGCDIWLKVSYGNDFHAIRFSPDDTIPQLRAFTNHLDSIWSRMGDFPPDLLDNF